MELEKTPQFLKGYDLLKIPILDAAKKSAWPDRFPLHKIKELLYRSGPYKFNSQMLLIPPTPTDNFFDTSLINLYDAKLKITTANGQTLYTLNDIKLDFGIISWDPSLGKSQGDSSVCACIFKSGNQVFIHDILYIKSENNQINARHQCENVLNFMEKNSLPNIVLETNGIGAFLSSTLKEIATQKKYPIFLTEKTQKENKNERIINIIQPLLYSGNFFLNTNIDSQILLYEIQNFKPNMTNNKDDTIDAITTALRTPSGNLKRTLLFEKFSQKRTYTAKTTFDI